MATTQASETNQPHDENYHFLYNPFGKAITICERNLPDNAFKLFFKSPFYAPLLFPNQSSDARDHAANERTFLSWLRLAVYLAVVSVAIILNFHLKHQPTPLEQSISKPLGFIFWILALCCLASGFAIYVRTVSKYARRRALVQSGWKTQVIFGVVATSIIAACGVFLGAESQASNLRSSAQALNGQQTENLDSPGREIWRMYVEQLVLAAGKAEHSINP